MRFCTNCGKRLDDDAQFCTNCGTPVPSCELTPTPRPSQSANAPIPIPSNSAPDSPSKNSPAQNGVPAGTPPAFTPPNPATATTTPPTAAQTRTKKTLIIIIAAIVVVALIATIVGFGTYRAQVWGGKTVPSPIELGVVKSDKTDEFSAADVEASLHKRGFKTVRKQRFSAKPKGSFLKYQGIEPNKRYSTRSQPITIIASIGPGVPEGTSGKPVQNVTDNLKSMGVPVHYYKVITNTDKTKEGTVIASYPADGQAVSDSKTGINVGVATSGNGINYDVVGQDRNQAQQQYTSKGFDVTLVPRFSSKSRIGKIVDSQPKPGTATTGGNLTLYYGIDASGMNDAVRFNPDDSNINTTGVNTGLAPVEGTYCTNHNKCITLSPSGDSGIDAGRSWVKSSESSGDDTADGTGTGHALLFCHNGGDPGCPANTDPRKGSREELYYQNKGAFELMDSTISQINCGTGVIARWDPEDTCLNGQVTPRSDNPSQSESMSGASYEMKTHYVYFPVGSDVKGVVDSGYFDKDATAEAAKEKDVDTSRPFFIRRDKNLYKTTKVNVPTLDTLNPFVPEVEQPGHRMVATKPAPSDETAYYLVEDPQLDWASLPEFTISKNGRKADPKPTAKNATPDQITAATGKGDFSLIAGKYCTIGNECLDLSKTGLLTGGKTHSSSQLHLGTNDEMWSSSAHNADPASQYLNLLGPDSEYSCVTATGAACKDHTPLSDIIWPTDMIYVFKNANTSSWYSGQDDMHGPGWDIYNTQSALTGSKPASTTRPYLYPMTNRMNPAPADNSVYYLQE